MQIMPIDLVRGEVELPSLSNVFQQFTAKLDDPGATAEDFSDIISTDPALTVRLLKLVNSAYYSFAATITDVAHAITIIGLNDLREMILAISVVEFFEGLPNELTGMQTFWNHSVLTGLLAKEMQSSTAIKSKQSLFTAGMLHDVGSLVFYNRLPEIARSVLERNDREHQPRYLLEREILGFDHAAIGGELMRHWELPEFLSDVVANHHEPQQSKAFTEEAMVINLTDKIARNLEKGEESVQQIMYEIGDISLGVSETDVEVSVSKAREKLSSVLSAIQAV